MCLNSNVPDPPKPPAPPPAPAEAAEVQSGVNDKGVKRKAKQAQSVFYRNNNGLSVGGNTGSGMNIGASN